MQPASYTTTATPFTPARVRAPLLTAPTAQALIATGSTRAAVSVDALIAACHNPARLRNPASSLGCSPILRATLDRFAVTYRVVRELADDGDPHSHLGGNAIDVDDGAGDAIQLALAVRTVPSLFAAGLWVSASTPGDSLYLWDGQLVDASAFDDQATTVYTQALHLSSSTERLAQALADPAVQAALAAAASS